MVNEMEMENFVTELKEHNAEPEITATIQYYKCFKIYKNDKNNRMTV